MTQLADSLDRLGTETAFEVLARAKALEAQGREIIHLQIGEPDFDTPAARRRGCGEGAAGRADPLLPRAGHPAATGGGGGLSLPLTRASRSTRRTSS